MRRIVLAITSLLLVGCGPMGERTGAVLIRTDAAGKMSSVSMRQSTGNPQADRRFIQFARSAFPTRVLKPKPNHNYIYPVYGRSGRIAGDITVYPRLGPNVE